MLYITKEFLGLPVKFGGIIAIETAILSNFMLNNFWTWKDSRDTPFLQRLLKYHGVTIFSGGINYGILLLLTHFGLYYLIANMIGIGCGMIINFFFNHFWTFRKEKD
jgi:dolichol-phosphate mannosyltransferase